MNTTLSPQQVRLVALLGLLAAAVLAWWMLVARQAAETSSPVTAPAHTKPAHTTPATTTPATPVHPTRPATKPAPKPVKIATHGLPLSVAQALRKHRVVVVALYTPGAVIDKLARAESKAGAHSSGAGFVALDVYRQKDGAPLLRKLGVVDAPAVLVVRRPATVFAQIGGFADRRIVEQAVANARR